jgi:DNA-binding SARP family transcriptional activator
MAGALHPFSQSDPAYRARIDEEEARLRQLISRHPDSRSLSVYLIFLLAANDRCTAAIRECRRILRLYPEDPVALLWKELIRLRWHEVARRRRIRRSVHRDRRWQHVSPDAC